MTNFMKREKDLIAEFQKEMDGYGLKVDNGTGGRYGEGCYHLEMTTKIERAKGKKALIALLLENGYTVNKFMFTDRKTGERYMAFKVYKYATMEDRDDDADEYVEPQQEPEEINEIFRKNEFAVQVIARGAFLDNDPGYGGKVYQVETATIRLNHIALNEWLCNQANRCREDFDTDKEWAAYMDRQRNITNELNRKIAAAAGFPPIPDNANVNVQQVISEVFAVAYIHEKEA